MIAGTFSRGFDRIYPFRVLAAAAALWYFRRFCAAVRWTCSWTVVAIGSVTFVIRMALEPTPTDSAEKMALVAGVAGPGASSGTIWRSFRMIGSVATVPLAEELAFRVTSFVG